MRSFLDIDEFSSRFGEVTVQGRAKALDMKPDLPFNTDKIVGIDLTHIIHTSSVAVAGAKPGGGGGGGGTSGFAPYTSGPANAAAGYNITIEFKGSWTTDLYNIFVSSADRLTSLIIGDLPNITVYGSKGGPKTVDDILITAELGNIDGLYGVLGQAGPTAVRTAGSLPGTATMKFDIVDVNDMGLAAFTSVVLHEMAHSLGFGSIWGRLGLVQNGVFTGDSANAEYFAMGGTGAGIPIEQDGGSGTAGSHWDEETFGNELMTGYINDGANYFTAMSAASFEDMGYVIRSDYANWADKGYMFA